MKIRNGFISNSSSCSFVLIGVEIDKDKLDKTELLKKLNIQEYNNILKESKNDEDFEDMLNETLMDLLDENGIYFCNHWECGASRNKILFGSLLAESSSDDDFFEFKQSLNDLDDIKELLNKFDLQDEEIKIIGGTRMC